MDKCSSSFQIPLVGFLSVVCDPTLFTLQIHLLSQLSSSARFHTLESLFEVEWIIRLILLSTLVHLMLCYSGELSQEIYCVFILVLGHCRGLFLSKTSLNPELYATMAFFSLICLLSWSTYKNIFKSLSCLFKVFHVYYPHLILCSAVSHL